MKKQNNKLTPIKRKQTAIRKKQKNQRKQERIEPKQKTTSKENKSRSHIKTPLIAPTQKYFIQIPHTNERGENKGR